LLTEKFVADVSKTAVIVYVDVVDVIVYRYVPVFKGSFMLKLILLFGAGQVAEIVPEVFVIVGY
jgi:hypothetical protein